MLDHLFSFAPVCLRMYLYLSVRMCWYTFPIQNHHPPTKCLEHICNIFCKIYHFHFAYHFCKYLCEALFQQTTIWTRQVPFALALNGFFGRLSGLQGALRSAFRIILGHSIDSFLAATVVVSVFVRVSLRYACSTRFALYVLIYNLILVCSATLGGINQGAKHLLALLFFHYDVCLFLTKPPVENPGTVN